MGYHAPCAAIIKFKSPGNGQREYWKFLWPWDGKEFGPRGGRVSLMVDTVLSPRMASRFECSADQVVLKPSPLHGHESTLHLPPPPPPSPQTPGPVFLSNNLLIVNYFVSHKRIYRAMRMTCWQLVSGALDSTLRPREQHYLRELSVCRRQDGEAKNCLRDRRSSHDSSVGTRSESLGKNRALGLLGLLGLRISAQIKQPATEKSEARDVNLIPA